MGAINFNKAFVEMIKDTSKPHTIRKTARVKVGEMVRLYTGMRTKECKLIIDWIPVLGVQPIRIMFGEGIFLDGRKLSITEAEGLVYNDGFRRGTMPNFEDFWRWFCPEFQLGQCFDGYLISWGKHNLLEATQCPA